jgi:hypothetical protein
MLGVESLVCCMYRLMRGFVSIVCVCCFYCLEKRVFIMRGFLVKELQCKYVEDSNVLSFLSDY